MWRFTEFHDEYRRKGWKQADFASGVGCVSVCLCDDYLDVIADRNMCADHATSVGICLADAPHGLGSIVE